MRIFVPIAKIDAEKREVWGYASTQARDDQGEIVTLPALQAALGDYMRFANIREMHQLSAVGTAKEASVDDRGLYVGAKIVDPLAWEKVKEGVYKGYSIGGRVTERNPTDRNTITGLTLNEISLVDRPANPEAVFDYFRAAGASPMADSQPFNAPLQIWACGVSEHRHITKADCSKCIETQAMAKAAEQINAEDHRIKDGIAALEATADAVQKGGDEPGDGSKPYGDVEYADPGHQSDGKKRYPIDTEAHIRAAWSYINHPKNAKKYDPKDLASIKAKIVAAWKEKIDKDGPPSADDKEKAAASSIEKALWDVGHVAHIILDLDWLKDSLETEAAMEGDDSPQPARLQAIVAELCGFLNALVAEETAEVVSDTEVSPMAMGGLAMVSQRPDHAVALAKALGALPDEKKIFEQFRADLLAVVEINMGKAGAKHSAADQAMLDMAYHAASQCAGMSGLSDGQKGHMDEAAKCFKAAGAGEAAAVDAGALHQGAGNSEAGVTAGHGNEAPAKSNPPAAEYHGQNATRDTGRNPSGAAPQVDASGTGSGSGIDHLMNASVIEALAKRHGGHQVLMDMAHDCTAKLTDGMSCGMGKAGSRHSAETMGHLNAAHAHLVAAGAQCDKASNAVPGAKPTAAGESETDTGGTGDNQKAAAVVVDQSEALAKLAAEHAADKDALAKTIETLTARVEELAKQPMPPLTIARDGTVPLPDGRTLTPVSKAADNGGGAGEMELTEEAMVEAFAKMSQEDRAMLLIKASRRDPTSQIAIENIGRPRAR